MGEPLCPVSVAVAAYPAFKASASSPLLIIPANPPLPRPCSLPFQPAAGSQTSILMSESDVGFACATTRQNAGRVLYKPELSSPASGSGGPEKLPAAILCAEVIVAPGIFSPASF